MIVAVALPGEAPYAQLVSDSEAAFAAISARLLLERDVSAGTGFGSNAGLRVKGKIFAMLVRGELVVKLPAARCVALVSSGLARPVRSRSGTTAQVLDLRQRDGRVALAVAGGRSPGLRRRVRRAP